MPRRTNMVMTFGWTRASADRTRSKGDVLHLAPEGSAEFAPDRAVEIISPSEEPVDMARKVGGYSALSAQQVWHMFPETQMIEVFRSPSEAKVYQPDEEIDLDDLLPSFRSRVAELFGKKRGVAGKFTDSPSRTCQCFSWLLLRPPTGCSHAKLPFAEVVPH